ncbi:type III-B CRISPR module-associated protein Cmr3 [uncultured Clostridium sp.]|uniref:type III-B CRISPR module-associated protein Cmr3 n=1 Tax=uncultured Clostridium sp. TaxID=59620 RepID=UPI0025D112AD|nr:type III-B CRISPR module-associated protein Cmr3 [uncultured Clostridium sp.]
MGLLNIKPCDNTFFGDGSQFKFGINNFIKSKNIPYSSTFFGAVFTAILSKNDSFRKIFLDKKDKNSYDHEKILKLGQVYLYNNVTSMAYIPAPKDLFVNSKGRKAFGNFIELKKSMISIPYERILQSPRDSDYEMANNKYINIEDIYSLYLNRISDDIELVDENQIFIKNNKIGIKLDKSTGSVEESMLYRIEQTEFLDDLKENKNWSYLVEYKICRDYLNRYYEGIKVDDLDSGYLKLGGENKVCRFKKMKDSREYRCIENFNAKKKVKLNEGIYKVIFTSDAFFERDIDESFGSDVKIIGIANYKPIYIGGFDMKSGIRKMYKGYAAGTVVLMKVLSQSAELKIEPPNSKGFNKYIILEEGI